MSRTAQYLCREISYRFGELALATPQSGTLSTLIDTGLDQYFPQDIEKLNAWVYGCPDVVLQNRGIERRAQSYTQASHTMLFLAAWPTAVTGAGTYEVRLRNPRSRILEALNDAVGQLGILWFRKFVDESLTTLNNTWRYTLPAGQDWSNVSRVEIQTSVDTTLVGYPYQDAAPFNYRLRSQLDQTGVETWYLEFGLLPPPGRIIRIFGESYYTDLVNDADVLGLGGKWERPAMQWIYDWALYRLYEWAGNRSNTEYQKTRQKDLDQLEKQKDRILMLAPPHAPGRVNTPGYGDAQAVPSPGDRDYLGAFGALHSP